MMFIDFRTQRKFQISFFIEPEFLTDEEQEALTAACHFFRKNECVHTVGYTLDTDDFITINAHLGVDVEERFKEEVRNRLREHPETFANGLYVRSEIYGSLDAFILKEWLREDTMKAVYEPTAKDVQIAGTGLPDALKIR